MLLFPRETTETGRGREWTCLGWNVSLCSYHSYTWVWKQNWLGKTRIRTHRIHFHVILVPWFQVLERIIEVGLGPFSASQRPMGFSPLPSSGSSGSVFWGLVFGSGYVMLISSWFISSFMSLSSHPSIRSLIQEAFATVRSVPGSVLGFGAGMWVRLCPCTQQPPTFRLEENRVRGLCWNVTGMNGQLFVEKGKK